MTPLEKIKFRAWGKCEKKMYFNVQNIYDPCGGEYPRADCFGHVLNTRISEICCCESEHAEDDDFAFEVMQFTGLLDKNGKEIYCGDILSFTVFDHNDNDTQYKGVVKFNNGEWQLWSSNEDEYYGANGAFSLYWVEQQDSELEIIGNIWENKDLLK